MVSQIFQERDYGQRSSSKGLFSWRFIAAVVVLVIAAAGVVAAVAGQGSENKSISNAPQMFESTQSTPDSSPFPFQELTIPYLRNREYVSQLHELEMYQEQEAYTSYLTSYDSDGLRVNGLITIPNGEEPKEGWPAVVFVHGYIPPSTYRTTEKYGDYVDYLARSGLVVFKIDLRGHGQSEGVPGGAYYSGDYVIDTLNAHAALTTANYVNPNEIGLWGHSMAGNVVFRSLVANPKVKKAVIWAGAVYSYTDWDKYSISDTSYRPPDEDSPRREERERLRETYGRFEPESEFWQQVVPLNYTDGVEAELEVHHATDDNVVDIGYSRDLITALEGSGIAAKLYEYPNGGHNITSSSFSTAIRRTAEFLR